MILNNHFNEFRCYYWGFFLFGIVYFGKVQWLFGIVGAFFTLLFLYFIKYIQFIRRNINEVRYLQEEFNKSIDNFLSEEKKKEFFLEECIICMENFLNKDSGNPFSIKCPCKDQFYHYQCITEWLLKKGTCPICRSDLKSKILLS